MTSCNSSREHYSPRYLPSTLCRKIPVSQDKPRTLRNSVLSRCSSYSWSGDWFKICFTKAAGTPHKSALQIVSSGYTFSSCTWWKGCFSDRGHAARNELLQTLQDWKQSQPDSSSFLRSQKILAAESHHQEFLGAVGFPKILADLIFTLNNIFAP